MVPTAYQRTHGWAAPWRTNEDRRGNGTLSLTTRKTIACAFRSELKPTVEFTEWHADVLAIGGPRLQPLIPVLNVRQPRARQAEVEIAIEMRPDWNVGK